MNNYENFKDSNIDWIGRIPQHWDVIKPKYKLNKVTRPTDKDDEVITCFRDGVVTLRKNRREDGFTVSLKEHGYQQICPGDLVVHEMDGFEGAIGISDSKGKSTPVYTVIEPNQNTDLRYIAYLLRVMSKTGKIESLARSIRERTTDFRWNMWSVINFPFPPIKEQKEISKYLDKKTNEIDLLIVKIKRKIELLQEQKNAIIHQYITKGLDKDAEMKSSGIEWIGDIPKNWNLIKVRYLCDISTGSKDTQDNDEEGIYPFFVRSPKIQRINSFSFDGEAVLTSGDGAGVGKIFNYFNGKFDYHQRVYKFSNFKNISGRFFYWFFKEHFSYEILRWNAKSTVDSVRLPLIQNFPIVIPSIDTQKNILEVIEKYASRIDQLLVRLEKKIQLLREYRQSLISSVVTGKIRITENMI